MKYIIPLHLDSTAYLSFALALIVIFQCHCKQMWEQLPWTIS